MSGSQQKQNHLIPIIMMMALFAMISFVTGLSTPMGVIVKEQFGASNAMSQLGIFANFIAYAIMGIPSGLMIRKYGYRTTALCAVAVGFVGVLIQFLSGQTGSFSVYLIGAFVAGFSMCMLNAVVNPMLNTLGGGGKKGNALLQLGGSVNSLSATIVPVLVGYLIGGALKPSISDASPAMYIAMGIFAVVFVVFFLLQIPEPHLEPVAKSKEKDKHSPLSFRHFILGAIAIFTYVGVEVGIQSIANIFMTTEVEKGGLAMDKTIAGSVVGTYWFLMMIGRLTGAAIGSKVSSKVMLSTVTITGLILVITAIYTPIATTIGMPVFQSDISFGIVQVPLSIMLLILCGLCTSVMWGGIFNLAVEGLGKYTALASGIFMVMVCGGGVLPFVQGLVADSIGFLNSYWVVAAGIAYMLFYALIGSKNVNKNIPVE